MNSVVNINSTKIPRRPWTKNEDTLLIELLVNGTDYGHAGKVLGRTYASINNRAIKHGFSKTNLNLSRTVNPKKGSRSRIKNSVRPKTRTNATDAHVYTSSLILKIRNYRIIIGLFTLAEAVTLTLLVM